MKNEKKHFNVSQLDSMSDAEAAQIIYGNEHVILGNYSIWGRQHHDRAAAIKQEGIKQGFIHPSRHEMNVEAHRKAQPQPRRVDEDERTSRDMFTEERARQIFFDGQKPNHADNLKAMEKAEPMRAYWTETALWSYGLLSNRPVKPTPKTEDAESTFPLSDELAQKYNLPKGVHVTLKELVDLGLKHTQKEAAAKAAKQEPQVLEPVTVGGAD